MSGHELSARSLQVEAPGYFGTHMVEAVSFNHYPGLYKFYFDHMVKPNPYINANFLDLGCGNQARTIAGWERAVSRLKYRPSIYSVDIMDPENEATTGNGIPIFRPFIKHDLRKSWREIGLVDGCIDAMVFSWSLHWLGEAGHKNALDEMSRVLKNGATVLLSTLTAYDVAIKNIVFLRSIIGKQQLKTEFPGCSVSCSHDRLGNQTLVVNLDSLIKPQLNEKGYFINPGHDRSRLGASERVGFSVKYLRVEFKKRDLEIVAEEVRPNKDFPNNYPPTLSEGRTKLLYILRKANHQRGE